MRLVAPHGVRVGSLADMPKMPPMPPMPIIRSEACGTKSSDTRTNITTIDGKTRRQVTIICTDRIEHMARSTALSAEAATRMAKINTTMALASIDHARNSITRDRNLSEEARRDALKGLDEATAKLKADIARTERD